MRSKDLISRFQLAGDLVLLNFIFFIVNYLKGGIVSNEKTLILFLYLNLFWLIATTALRTYKQKRVMRITTVLNVLIRTFILHLFLIFSFISILKQPLDSVKFFILKYSIFSLFVILFRIFTTFLMKTMRQRGYNYKKVVIAGGGGRVGNDIYNFFQKHPEYGYKCLGFFDDNKHHESRLGTLNELEEFALKNEVDEIYCVLSDLKDSKVHELISFADNNIIRLKIIPDFRGIGNYMVDVSFFDKIPVLSIRDFPLNSSANRLLKRAFDIFFSLLVIILIFPWLLPIVAIGIKLSSRGPVFFTQLRSGRGNQPFLCFKFRTMMVNKEAHELQAYKNDPRITSFGSFLRRKNLDELPQFFNVLIGDMSVVGPRPHMILHTQKYSKEIDKFMLRHFVLGGITGLAQVKGFRGETKELSQMKERLKLDVWYIENWSFYLDIKIIFNTFSTMFTSKNDGF